jgi:choline-sulfatase
VWLILGVVTRFAPALALTLVAIGCGGAPAASASSPPSAVQRSGSPDRGLAAEPEGRPSPPAAPAAEPAAPPKLMRPAEPLNVILLVVDAMRADMPWAGYPRKIAPNLTAIEKQSVSYTRAYAVSSYTAKSIGALLSGQYPSSLKRSGYFFTRYPDTNLFFAELLQQAGVHTMGAHAHRYLRRENGLAQGFVAWDLVEGITFNNKYDLNVTSDKLTQLAIRQLEAAPPDRRRFMYLHYMDPHDIYVKHEEAPDWGKKLRDKYDQEIFYTDLWLGRFLDYCRKQPWWKQTALIVTSDHGEGFGEHHRYRHAFELWEMLVHVPMFFQVPGAEPRRIDTPRSHIDLAPTIVELTGVEGAPEFRGQSLVPELFGAEPAARPVLMDLPPDSNNDERRALVDGDYKLLVYGGDYRFELYNLAADPEEKKNLAKREPEKLTEMKALYQKVWGEVPKVKPFGGNKLMGGGYATGPTE